MPLIYPTSLVPRTPENTNDLNSILTAINTWANGNIDTDDILDNAIETPKIKDAAVTAPKIADAALLGLSDGTSVRRGKSIIATTETFTQTSYGFATTPDRVQNIVLPTDGLIFVSYQATWQESVGGAAQAAIFVGANQVTIQHDESSGAAAGVQSAMTGGSAAADQILTTCQFGLVGAGRAAYNHGADVTTGQILGATLRDASSNGQFRAGSSNNRIIPGPNGLGGACVLEAAAGTYDVGIKFLSSSGSVTVKNRRLRVWTIAF